MTWLLFLNYYVLRWFGIRFARVVDEGTNQQIGWKLIRRWPNEGWRR